MSNTKDRNYRLTRKGQVTIPKEIRKHLGVSEGEAVRFEVEPDGDVVIRRASAPEEAESYEERVRKAVEWAQEHVDWGGMTADEYIELMCERAEV
jgi:AbrB family looped-hinge helix DNA binding protein